VTYLARGSHSGEVDAVPLVHQVKQVQQVVLMVFVKRY
jgi:hypothetical protein